MKDDYEGRVTEEAGEEGEEDDEVTVADRESELEEEQEEEDEEDDNEEEEEAETEGRCGRGLGIERCEGDDAKRVGAEEGLAGEPVRRITTGE